MHFWLVDEGGFEFVMEAIMKNKVVKMIQSSTYF